MKLSGVEPRGFFIASISMSRMSVRSLILHVEYSNSEHILSNLKL